jgi:hypothetical protein
MFKHITATLLLTGLLCATSASAGTTRTIADTKNTVGAGLNFDIDGREGDSVQNNVGILVQDTYRFAPNWSVTGMYTNAWNVSVTNSASTNIQRAILNINFDLAPQGSATPYILAGGGYESMSGIPNRDGALADFGAGFRMLLTDTIGFDLTGMAKFHLDHEDRALLFNAAVTYSF